MPSSLDARWRKCHDRSAQVLAQGREQHDAELVFLGAVDRNRLAEPIAGPDQESERKFVVQPLAGPERWRGGVGLLLPAGPPDRRSADDVDDHRLQPLRRERPIGEVECVLAPTEN